MNPKISELLVDHKRLTDLRTALLRQAEETQAMIWRIEGEIRLEQGRERQARGKAVTSA